MDENRKPQLHVITGPNGAGKSTLGKRILPNHQIFDGDKVYIEELKKKIISTNYREN